MEVSQNNLQFWMVISAFSELLIFSFPAQLHCYLCSCEIRRKLKNIEIKSKTWEASFFLMGSLPQNHFSSWLTQHSPSSLTAGLCDAPCVIVFVFTLSRKKKVYIGKFSVNHCKLHSSWAATCAKHSGWGGWHCWQTATAIWGLLGKWRQEQVCCCKHLKTDRAVFVGDWRKANSVFVSACVCLWGAEKMGNWIMVLVRKAVFLRHSRRDW